jgi:hypothetical protein
MVWYDMIWYDMIWYDMIWYDMIWYDMIWYDMIWYDIIWYDIIWYDMAIDMQWFMRVSNKHTRVPCGIVYAGPQKQGHVVGCAIPFK